MRVAQGRVGLEELEAAPLCRTLMETWSGPLTNRNAPDDRYRYKRHLLPVFGDRPVTAPTLVAVLDWIDAQRAAAKLSDVSLRHNLNLLSRCPRRSGTPHPW